MIVLCSGEGPSDIGANDYNSTSGIYDTPKFGAMGNMLLSILQKCREDYHDSDCHIIIHKKELQKRVDEISTLFLSGIDRPAGCAYFIKAAYSLALIALDKQNCSKDDVIAVLFRDSDPSSEAGNVLWKNKFKSIEDGFKLARFEFGVPMVPKPTSEAWCLAMFNASPSVCRKLEEKINRDELKHDLDNKLFDEHITKEEFYHRILTGELPLTELKDMNSFAVFQDKLCNALRKLDNAKCYQCNIDAYDNKKWR